MKKSFKAISLLFIISILLKFIDIFKNLYIASQFGVSDKADVFSSIIIMPEYILIFLGLDTLRGVINSEYSTWRNEKNDSEIVSSYIGISTFIIRSVPILILILILFNSQIISLILPGFSGEKKKLAENIFIIVLPILFLKSFIGFYHSILNSFKIFYFPLIANILVTLSILLLIFLNYPFKSLIYNIAIGTIIGNLLLFILLGYFSYSKIKYLFSKKIILWDFIINIFKFDINDSTKKILRSCYALFFVVVSNVVFLGSKNFLASYFGEGAISSINYASSIPVVITTLLFSSFFAYFLNSIASLNSNENEKKQKIFFNTFNNLLFLILFIVTFLLLNSFDILYLLYHRGNFDEKGIFLTYKPFIWEVLSIITFAMIIVPTAFFIAEKKYSILNRIGTILYLSGVFICYSLSMLIGYSGISAGMFITQFIYGGLLLFQVNKNVGGFWKYRYDLIKIISISISSLIISFVIKYYISNIHIIPNIDEKLQSVFISGILQFIMFILFSTIAGYNVFQVIIKNLKIKNEK